MSFDKLGLENGLLDSISEKGYEKPTPIQEKSIPVILDGRDVLGGAQTGTGKTAAFALPMIQLLNKSEREGRYPRALILTPTRELANQVEESILQYGANYDLTSTTVYGGVSYTKQIEKLTKGVDIIVACPGRLLDLAKQGHAVLENIEILVLDEADRMLDMGFSFEINRIMKMVPEKRQTLLFSATYSDEIKELAERFLENPEMVEVSPRNKTADNVDQLVYPVRKEQKYELLSRLIRWEKWTRALVFTKTKVGAETLKDYLLKDDIKAKAIHGNKSQAARDYALEDFKNGEVDILVATDVAARGLDIDHLSFVVNFDVPQAPEDYVHRIGRTGRAGKEGIAISFVSAGEQDFIRKIERVLKIKIEVREIDGFRQETREELECAKVLEKIKKEKKAKKAQEDPTPKVQADTMVEAKEADNRIKRKNHHPEMIKIEVKTEIRKSGMMKTVENQAAVQIQRTKVQEKENFPERVREAAK